MLNIILLGLTSLLADFSSEMIVPILPFFIQALGGGGIVIGLIFGVGDAVAAVLRVLSGYIADRTKRYKFLVFGGYLFSSLAKFAYPFAGGWSQIAVIRPIERLGKGVRDAPRDAIVSESVHESARGRGFGIQRAMDALGAIIGSVVVLVMFVMLGLSFRSIFLVSAFVSVGAVIPILFIKVPRGLHASRKAVSFKKLSPKARTFIGIATLFALANFSNAFFLLRAQGSFSGFSWQGALGLTLSLYIFLQLFDAVFSEPAGALSDRIGRRRTIVIGYSLFSVVTLGFLLMSFFPMADYEYLAFLLLFAVYGVFRAFIDASQRAFVSDLSPEEVRGTALGTFETMTGLAAIPAGLAAGWLWDLNPVWTFAFGFTLSLAAVILLIAAIRERQ